VRFFLLQMDAVFSKFILFSFVPCALWLERDGPRRLVSRSCTCTPRSAPLKVEWFTCDFVFSCPLTFPIRYPYPAFFSIAHRRRRTFRLFSILVLGIVSVELPEISLKPFLALAVMRIQRFFSPPLCFFFPIFQELLFPSLMSGERRADRLRFPLWPCDPGYFLACVFRALFFWRWPIAWVWMLVQGLPMREKFSFLRGVFFASALMIYTILIPAHVLAFALDVSFSIQVSD